MLKVGDAVIFADGYREEHPALVTTVWTQDMINVAFISTNEAETDQYGRQIKRESSVGRHSESNCYGRSFRAVDSEQPQYKTHPQQS